MESLSLTEVGMRLSAEVLGKAGEKGLRIAEVPIHVKDDGSFSTPIPVAHGLGLVLAPLNYISIRHPLLFYGVPGAVSFMTALFFWVWTLLIFAATGAVDTNIALIAVGATFVGLMLMTTSIILWVLVSVVREKP